MHGRDHQGKKYLGQLYDSIRNANIAFCSFLRSAEDDEVMQAVSGKRAPGFAASFNSALNKDRVELRRLSSILYAFIRQAIREHRHGYPVDCPVGKPNQPPSKSLSSDCNHLRVLVLIL